MDGLKKTLLFLTVGLLIFSWVVGKTNSTIGAEVREFTVIGEAALDNDQDQVYRAALENGLRKAFSMARQTYQSASLLTTPDREKDLITLQKELGIVDFRVLRYWNEQNQFRVELLVRFGESQRQPPRAGSWNRQPKVSWSKETIDRIESLSEYNLFLVINTLQSLEVVNPESGRLIRRIKTGFKPHMSYGDRYLVKNQEYLKIYSMDLISIYSFTDIWDQKLPDSAKFFIFNNTLYAVEQTGTVRAFNWADGRERWLLPATSQVELVSGGENRTVLVLPPRELWVVNSEGKKLWVKRFENDLAASLVVAEDNLFCLFNGGQIKVFDPETGREIASWETNIGDRLNQATLSLGQNEIYILYNDLSNRGHLHAYHRWTGSLLWKVDWDEAALPKLIQLSDAVVVGLSGTFEARERLFGLKIWEERSISRITGLYSKGENLLVVSGNQISCYEF